MLTLGENPVHKLLREFKKYIKQCAEENAIGFIASHEVELRRIAQISDKRFAQRTNLRFCAGGIAKERHDAEANLLEQWEDRGYSCTHSHGPGCLHASSACSSQMES